MPYYDLSRALPPRAGGIVVSERPFAGASVSGGLRPTRLLLPHQLYAKDYAENIELAVLPVLGPWFFVTGPQAGTYHGADPYGDLLDRLDATEESE